MARDWLFTAMRVSPQQSCKHSSTHQSHNYCHAALDLWHGSGHDNHCLLVGSEYSGWSQPPHLDNSLGGAHHSLCHSHPNSAKARFIQNEWKEQEITDGW